MCVMVDRNRCFALFATPDATVVDGRAKGFRGVAYSGGVVPNYGWAGDMAINLATLQAPVEVAILRNHDPNQIVGRAKVSCDGNSLTLEDGTFSEVTAAGKEVAGLMAEGQPWALSVGVNAKAQFFEPKRRVECNGQQIDVDCLLENARLLEVSFVPAGADPNAYAAQMSARMGLQSPNQEDHDMNELEQARARIAELEAQVATLTTARDAAQTALAAIATQARTDAITALFGADTLPAEPQMAAYLAMTAEQWGAVEMAVKAARPAPDSVLFRQQATAGRNEDTNTPTAEFAAPAGWSVDPERAQLHAQALQYQKAHPGTDYLAAVQAVAK